MGAIAAHGSIPSSPRRSPFSAQERERLILAHFPRVRHIARRIRQRLPGSVSLDDLVSTGVIGLIDAVDGFDSERQVKLSTYAEHKIRGAILDSLRRLDWAPRRLRKRAKQVSAAIHKLQQRLHRSPDEDEIASELNLTLDEYHGWLVAQNALDLECVEDAGVLAKCGIDSGELRVYLRVALSQLPEVESRILHLHCYEELQSREIAEILGLSEGRISQLKSQAILRLSGHIRSFKNRAPKPANAWNDYAPREASFSAG